MIEETNDAEPALDAIDQNAVVGVALGEIELAADDVVARALVADDIDSFDVDAGALVDEQRQLDGVVGVVAIGARNDPGKGVPGVGQRYRHVFERLLEIGGVEDPAGGDVNVAAERILVDPGDGRVRPEPRQTGRADPRRH